jgi:hypothetical protein
LSERFYSLPRPDSGRKSTGLGLNFVEEVVKAWRVDADRNVERCGSDFAPALKP